MQIVSDLHIDIYLFNSKVELNLDEKSRFMKVLLHFKFLINYTLFTFNLLKEANRKYDISSSLIFKLKKALAFNFI